MTENPNKINWFIVILAIVILWAGTSIYEIKLDSELEMKRIEVNRVMREREHEFKIKEQEFLKEILDLAN